MTKKCTALIVIFAMLWAMPHVMLTYASSVRSVSQEGVNLIKQLEGFHGTAYKALSTEKYYTIGYGHYGPDVYPGMTVTAEKAETMLRSDLKNSVDSVNKFLNANGIAVSQNQFDALVSFTYNCGIYVWNTSQDFTLRQMLLDGAYHYSDAQIRAAFVSWNTSGGRIVEGLSSRRNQEATMFLKNRVTPRPTPRYTPAPSAYKVSYRRLLSVNESDPAGARMNGTDVKYVQVCLYYLGYDVACDGYYSSGAADAVRAFQRHYSLDVDGKCGPATWKALEQAVAAHPALSSVAVRKKPAKQIYTAGEAFDAGGMVLKVTYADGTTGDVTDGFTCTPSGKLNTPGQQKIVVSFGGKSTGFYVTVRKAISSVVIRKKPDKLVYTVGESFSAGGMILKANYADGTTGELTDGFTCTPSGKLNTPGQQKIVVSCGGKSTGFYVTVNKAAASVAVKKKPDKQVYTVGESFNASGMILKVTRTDGTVDEVTSGFTCTPQKMHAAGQQKIVVSYGGKSTGFYVTVNKVVASVVIAKKPAKLNYVVGEFFDASGMILRATYTDGTTGEITGGYTFAPSGQLTRVGQQKIVVTYGGKSTGFYVTVEE